MKVKMNLKTNKDMFKFASKKSEKTELQNLITLRGKKSI